MKKQPKKLVLAKETVRVLRPAELEEAVTGALTQQDDRLSNHWQCFWSLNSCNNTCASC